MTGEEPRAMPGGERLMHLCVHRASWCARAWTTRATCVTGATAAGKPSAAATIMNCGVSSPHHHDGSVSVSGQQTWNSPCVEDLIRSLSTSMSSLLLPARALTEVYLQGSGWCGRSSLSWYAPAFASTGALSSASSSSAARMRSTSSPTERRTTILSCPFISVSLSVSALLSYLPE